MPDDHLGELTWSERAIIRRIRLGWTKADLSEACGVSRVTLWRVMECMDPERRMEPTDRVRTAVEDALLLGETSRDDASERVA